MSHTLLHCAVMLKMVRAQAELKEDICSSFLLWSTFVFQFVFWENFDFLKHACWYRTTHAIAWNNSCYSEQKMWEGSPDWNGDYPEIIIQNWVLKSQRNNSNQTSSDFSGLQHFQRPRLLRKEGTVLLWVSSGLNLKCLHITRQYPSFFPFHILPSNSQKYEPLCRLEKILL